MRGSIRAARQLASSVGYLPGAAVMGEGLADPSADPLVWVVAAGLKCLDHSRHPGRGCAVGEGVDHVTADQGIGILGQFEQPRPHPAVISPDMAGAQVLARELANPALVAPGQLKESIESIPGCAPVVRRQADAYLPGDLAESSHPLDPVAAGGVAQPLGAVDWHGGLELTSELVPAGA
jgi:hypothetical protein